MTTYCMLPRDLVGRLLEPLRSHFAESAGPTVIVERRSGERRSEVERRRADVPEAVPAAGDRRRIRNSEGRRVADRRVPVAEVPAPAPEDLPRRARRHAERLTFVKRVEPSAERLEDEDTARLVIAFQAGDQDAFATLYRRYFDRVYGYLRVVLRDRHEAEDGTQEAFVKALSALPGYERRGQPFRSWLFTIVRNHAMSLLEAASRLEVTDTVHSLERDPSRESSEESVLALDWLTNSDLLVLIERLPARQRQALILRFLLDLSPTEVARVLETSPENVRVLHHRALSFLRERMIALGREPSDRGRIRMRGVLHKARVLRRRRFVLTG